LAYRWVNERRLVECYHDATAAREQVLQMFNLACCRSSFVAMAERLYWGDVCEDRDVCRKLDRFAEELEDRGILSDTYFSTFGLPVAPDSWAIDQLFPDHCPFTGSTRRPTRLGVWLTSRATRRPRSIASSRCVTSKRTLELHERRMARNTTWLAFLVGRTRKPSGSAQPLGDTMWCTSPA